MSFRVAVVCCFLLLVTLATSSKISDKKGHKHHSKHSSLSEKSSKWMGKIKNSLKEKKLSHQQRSQPKHRSHQKLQKEPLLKLKRLRFATASNTTASSASSTTEKSMMNFCESSANGFYANPMDCKTFIFCVNKVAYMMYCPANLVYNQQISSCDYNQNVPGCF